MIELRFHWWQPTPLNQLVGNWRKAERLKGRDRQVIAVGYLRYPRATTKRRVTLTITLQPKQRAADPDAYWKSTLDGLVWCGALKDDSRQWVELAPVIFVRGTAMNWGTDIVLGDL